MSEIGDVIGISTGKPLNSTLRSPSPTDFTILVVNGH